MPPKPEKKPEENQESVIAKKPYPIRAWSKADIAGGYEIPYKLFKKWLDESPIDTGTSRILTPAICEQIVKEFGWPPVEPSARARRLRDEQKK